MKRKIREQKSKEHGFLLTASAALRMALEDAKTGHFIKTNFSDPQYKPHIISRTRLSRKNQHCRWIVEVKEEIPLSLNGKSGLMNIVRIEIEPFKGEIIRRLFLKYILEEEYQILLSGNPKRPSF
ncbi:MAG: hypothetical protein E3J22_02905 [Candidatus Aminicenantes bacterium]|nr:MAG: hypothetical protein E3J22_02905 [Candidatus Aminicenantes bacterium]